MSLYFAKQSTLHAGIIMDGNGRWAVARGLPRVAGHKAGVEAATAGGSRLWLRIAVDYSGRDAILAAARGAAELSLESLGSALGPPVDLIIRTGGERRLSDFLLWESAYAELVFSRTMWPDFVPADLAAAIREFHGRERRFAAIPDLPLRHREARLY